MSTNTPRRAWAWAATWAALALLTAILVAGAVFASPASSSVTQPAARQLGQIGQTLSETVYVPFAMQTYPAPPSIFGLEVLLSTGNAYVPDVQTLQPVWIRKNGLLWSDVEPAPGLRQWEEMSVLDAQVSQLSAAGFETMLIVRSTPSWAQYVEGMPCGPIRPENLDDFAGFLTDAVARYKEPPYNVQYWELWNEPDVDPGVISWPESPFGCWGDSGDPYYGGGYYGEMLSYAYPAIKAADPEAQVLIGGLLLDCDPENPPPGKSCTPSRFLEGILINGGGDYFDIANMHAYAYYGLPGDPVYPRIYNWNWAYGEPSTGISEKAHFVRQTLQNYGYEKPLFNTEVALDCTIGTDDCYEVQSMYAVRAYAEALALDLQAQVWFALRSDWKNTGLLYSTPGTYKPAYYAYQTTVEELESAVYLGPVTSYPPLEGYTFAGSSILIQVVWSADEAVHTITLPAETVRVVDRYGMEIEPSGGAIEVGLAPVFIEVTP
jgi:hypothetical protein